MVAFLNNALNSRYRIPKYNKSLEDKKGTRLKGDLKTLYT